jgi:hypothetical protein
MEKKLVSRIEGRIDSSTFSAILLDEIATRLLDIQKSLEDLKIINKMALGFKPQLFTKPYQYKELAAGESGVVYEYDIEKEYGGQYVGMITQLANSWYEDTYLLWHIDERSIERATKIEREIAPINNPLRVNYYVERKIIFEAYNNSNTAYVFEVLCNGFLIEKSIYKILKI